MKKIIQKKDLPHFVSTRDNRERLDLITENTQCNKKYIRADRIIYHQGDTCAKHFHKKSHHVFYILEGEGLIFNNESKQNLKPGMVIVVDPDEIHWFENKNDSKLKFIEFWIPPPSKTIWIDDDDI